MSDSVKLQVRLPVTSSTCAIESVDEQNEGRYYCKVTNRLGIKEAYADLTVLGKISAILVYHIYASVERAFHSLLLL